MPVVSTYYTSPLWMHSSCLFYLVAQDQAEGSMELKTHSVRGIETDIWTEGDGWVCWTREKTFSCLKSKAALKFWDTPVKLHIATKKGFNFPEVGITIVIVRYIREEYVGNRDRLVYQITNNAVYFEMRNWDSHNERIKYWSPYKNWAGDYWRIDTSDYVDVIFIRYINNSYDVFVRRYRSKESYYKHYTFYDPRSPSSDWPLIISISDHVDLDKNTVPYLGAVMVFEGDILHNINHCYYAPGYNVLPLV